MKKKKLTQSEKNLKVNEQRFALIITMCNVLDAEKGVSNGVKSAISASLINMMEFSFIEDDEPLANLDINAQQLLLQDLKFFVRSKVHPLSIILSSQNLHELERIADNIVFIRQGKTVFNGKQNQFGRENLLQHFEISGNFSLKELQVAFPGTKIEDTGTTYIVSVNKETKWFEILSKLNQHNLELNYYRNITNSTRQLFHKDI